MSCGLREERRHQLAARAGRDEHEEADQAQLAACLDQLPPQALVRVVGVQEGERAAEQRRVVDPDGLASVYRQCCHRPLIEAKIMGMRDEIAIKHDTILQRKQTLNNFKDQYFNHFKTLAKSYVKAERLEI